MKKLAYHDSHDFPSACDPQTYLAKARRNDQPTDHGMEKRVRERLDSKRQQFEATAQIAR